MTAATDSRHRCRPPSRRIATPGSAGPASTRVVRTGRRGHALWLSLLLVTYWWIAGGGIQDLGGWATGLTSLGRLTGLVASDLLLVQVLLMARMPAAGARRSARTGWRGSTGSSASRRST